MKYLINTFLVINIINIFGANLYAASDELVYKKVNPNKKVYTKDVENIRYDIEHDLLDKDTIYIKLNCNNYENFIQEAMEKVPVNKMSDTLNYLACGIF